jgi:hypothetical protein
VASKILLTQDNFTLILPRNKKLNYLYNVPVIELVENPSKFQANLVDI